MQPRTLDPDLAAELAALATAAGCELIHTEFKGGTLRLVLDSPEGVSLQHCETVSKQASALLDVSDFGGGRYTLEVSSPGLDRELYSPGDYARFLGQNARVTWQDASMPTRRTIVGRLESFDPADGGCLKLREESNREEHQIRLRDIQVARLQPEY